MSYLVDHWSLAWPALTCYAAIVVVHLVGLRRRAVTPAPGPDPAGDRARPPWRESVAFHCGLLSAVLAMISPIAYWSARYIWVRSAQDLVLAVFAPMLIVLGAPWLALRQGASRRTPGQARPRRDTPGDRGPPGGDSAEQARVPWLLAWPAAVTAVFNAVWLGWHLPLFYDLAATRAAARYAEYVLYLAVGTLFWLQLIGSRPWSPRSSPLRRLALLVVTVAADTVLGMALVFGASPYYPAYSGPGRGVLGLVADQQAGGAVLWMGMVPPFTIAAVALLNTWLAREDSDELEADMKRLTGWHDAGRAATGRSPGSAWPSRPGYRRRMI
jgi:cytochrome c oxidase assembly factor CtaG